MNIHHLISSSLLLAGCGAVSKPVSSVDGCNPESDTIELEVDLLAEKILAYQQIYGIPYDEMACEDVCREEVTFATSWELESIDSCSLSFAISESPDPEAVDYDPTAVVGELSCAANVIEYWCMGRRPLGHQELKDADYFVQAAHLEAASVDAFAELGRTLKRWGAPQDLIDRTFVAAQEEILHAILFARLAGIERIPTCVKEQKEGTLLELALHNAVEGCIFEGWAALQAHHMLTGISDPQLQSIMRTIARDETNHAQLSWDIHVWLLAQLSEAEQAQVAAAQAEALAQLPELAVANNAALPEQLRGDRAQVQCLASCFAEQIAA